MDACIVLQKKIRQCYKIKQEDKHFFFPPHLLKCISIYKRKLLSLNPLLETPSICNDENLLSHIIRDITFRAYIINQQVGE